MDILCWREYVIPYQTRRLLTAFCFPHGAGHQIQSFMSRDYRCELLYLAFKWLYIHSLLPDYISLRISHFIVRSIIVTPPLSLVLDIVLHSC